MTELVADAAAFVEAALAETGRARAHVVGHDWGALVAWALAGLRPELVRTVTGISVPPLGAMSAAFHRPRQLRASWYMAAFQVPGPGRAGLRRARRPVLVARPGPHARPLRARPASGPNATPPASPIPAALTAALNWYRALARRRRRGSRRRRCPRSTCGATATPR